MIEVSKKMDIYEYSKGNKCLMGSNKLTEEAQ
jgi:hypothetical protein